MPYHLNSTERNFIVFLRARMGERDELGLDTSFIETLISDVESGRYRKSANERGETPAFVSGYESGDSEFSEFIQRFTE